MSCKKITRQQVISAISCRYNIKKTFIVLLEDGTAMIYSDLEEAKEAEISFVNSTRGIEK